MTLVLASAVLAVDPDSVYGPPLSTAEVVLLYVVLPLLVLGACALLALSSGFRGARYRPGRSWGRAAIWFGGPDDAEEAVRATDATGHRTGGSRGTW